MSEKIDCAKHGLRSTVVYKDTDVCCECYAEYLEFVEDEGKQALMAIHHTIGRTLEKKLNDPEAFEAFKILTSQGLDVITMYNDLVNEVCRKAKMN